MTSFHEVRFPDNIAYGATGGPEFATTVVATRSGPLLCTTATTCLGVKIGRRSGVTPRSWTRARPVIDQAGRRRLVFSNCTGLR